jgi:uncharacterized protein YegL
VFIEKAVTFRIKRVREWITINIEKYKDNEDFQDLLTNLEHLVYQKEKELIANLKLCKMQCSQCFALCVKQQCHTDEHECNTVHICEDFCHYCHNVDENIKSNCKFAYGHENVHLCREKQHTCGQPCKFKENNKCYGECHLMSGHEDDHVCAIQEHKCKIKCSLNECEALCNLKATDPHTIHKCIKEFCTKKCIISNCNLQCSCKDHFHGTELSAKYKEENNIPEEEDNFQDEEGKKFKLNFHICGNTHQCDRECEKDGYCNVTVEKKVVEEEYVGKKGTFKYTKQFVERGEKLHCIKTLGPYETNHEGEHLHKVEENTVHFCMTKCPTCENICDMPFNHPGRHKTQHGNMTNCFFISNQEDLDVGDHQYVVGESAKAEMCDMFCRKLGRGHIHIIECDSESNNCQYDKNIHKKRHETTKYGPDENVPKDEILHDAYWEHINFEDPSGEADKEKYGNCPFYCSSEIHKENCDERIFCEQPIWHDKLTDLNQINKTTGSISVDGHYFTCKHDSAAGFHFLLCLDESGSMTGDPWTQLSLAVRSFITARNNSTVDKISIIQYDDTARVVVENASINSGPQLQSFRGGGTDFSVAISTSHSLFKKYISNKLTPVFIFMSDGGASNGLTEMTSMYEEFKTNGIRIYTVAFGSGIQMLRDLAHRGKGSYIECVTGIDLRKDFVGISSELGVKISVAKSSK